MNKYVTPETVAFARDIGRSFAINFAGSVGVFGGLIAVGVVADKFKSKDKTETIIASPIEN